MHVVQENVLNIAATNLNSKVTKIGQMSDTESKQHKSSCRGCVNSNKKSRYLVSDYKCIFFQQLEYLLEKNGSK